MTEGEGKTESDTSLDDVGSNGNDENDEIDGEEEIENSGEEDYSESGSGDNYTLKGTSGETDYDSEDLVYEDYNVVDDTDGTAESNSSSDEGDNESVDDVGILAASSSDSDSSANQASDDGFEIIERVSPGPGM